MSDEQKNLAVLAPEPKPKRAPTVYFIAGIKLLKGVGALLLALEVFRLEDKNLPEDFRKLLEFLHIDPEKKFFLEIANRIGEITTNNMKWGGRLAIIYGLFMLLQAVGLAFRASWAVWLVIAESAFFIPIEVFELVRRHIPNPEHPHLINPKIGIAIVLALNVMIVWYLFQNRERIIRHHHHH